MRRLSCISSVYFFLAVVSAGAQGQLIGENLLVEIPAGYELGFSQKTDQGEINEFVPKGETVEKWSEMITVLLLPARLDNAAFYASFESGVKKSCRAGYTHVIATGAENGYAAKVFQLLCPTNLQTNMGEVTFIKSIEGKDKFYVVQKAWRTKEFDLESLPITNDEIVKWTTYLRDVLVCDSRVKRSKCP